MKLIEVLELSIDVITAGTGERYSTGFAVTVKYNILRILTSAHSMDDVFTFGMSRSIEDLNRVF